MNTNRLDWTIQQKAMWIATAPDNTVIVARTRAELNSKINKFERTL
jgi:hypothetical protein